MIFKVKPTYRPSQLTILSLWGIVILLTSCANPISTSILTKAIATQSSLTAPTQILSPSQSSPEINTTIESSVTPDPSPTIRPVTARILFFYPFTSTELYAFQAQVALFRQQHPEIEVKVENRLPETTNSNFYETYAGSFDCFAAQNDPQGAVGSGQVLELDSFLKNEGPSFQNDFDPSLLAASRYQGKLYDLLLTTQPTVMSYNADLLSSLGLQVPSNDWTFDDFVSLMQAATRKTDLGAPKSFGFLLDGRSVNTIDFLLAGRKAQWLDTTGSLPVAIINSPKMAETLAWWAGISDSLDFAGTEPYWEPYWVGSSASNFMSNSLPVAFWISLAGEAKGGFPNVTFKTGVVPLPEMADGGEPFQQSYDLAFYISNQSKNPQACWEWFKFLSAQPTAFPGIPARASMAASPAWEASVGAESAQVYRLAESRIDRSENTRLFHNRLTDVLYSLSYDPLYVEGPLRDWLWQVIQTVDAHSPYDPAELLLLAQQKADSYLACMQGVSLSKLSSIEIKDTVKSCAIQADPQGNWIQ